MGEILKNELLEFYPDTLQSVRESCGLSEPGRVDEAIDLLQDWIAKQDHFLRKNFSRRYLETTLLMSKGSVEKSKQRLDLICTMRTVAPHFFDKFDALNDFQAIRNAGYVVLLPQLTDDHYRVGLLKLSGNHYPSFYRQLFQYVIIICEYLKLHDYCNGFVFVVDTKGINPLDFVTKMNFIELRDIVTLVTKGYGARIKSIHFVSTSKLVEGYIAMLNKVLSAKITSRISLQKNFEELHQHLPRRILPVDMGGDEISTEKLFDKWMEVTSSEEHVKHMKEMREARTDESRRLGADIIDPMFGLPGTFRSLNLD